MVILVVIFLTLLKVQRDNLTGILHFGITVMWSFPCGYLETISTDLDIVWGMLCVILPHASPNLYACLLTSPLSLCLLVISYLSLSLAFFSTPVYLFVPSWFCVISCIYYTFLGLIMCILPLS